MFGDYKPAFTYYAIGTHYTSWSYVKCSEETEWKNVRLRRLREAELVKAFYGTRRSIYFSIENFTGSYPQIDQSIPRIPCYFYSPTITLRFALQILPTTEEFYDFNTSKYIHNRTGHQGHSIACKALTFRKMCRGLYWRIKLYFNIILPTISIFSSVALCTMSKLAITPSLVFVSRTHR